METPVPFHLASTYAFLEDGGSAPRIETGPDFWKDLMSGHPQSPGAKLLAEGDGWLVAMYEIDKDNDAWEMHPAGDELLAMISGEMHVVFELGGAEVVVELPAGSACVVPRGTWHRQVVRRAGTYLGATYGKGTQHRAR